MRIATLILLLTPFFKTDLFTNQRIVLLIRFLDPKLTLIIKGLTVKSQSGTKAIANIAEAKELILPVFPSEKGLIVCE